jgi:WD40 repeat protein
VGVLCGAGGQFPRRASSVPNFICGKGALDITVLIPNDEDVERSEMVKKSTKRLVYVLSPSGSSSGHSLGVNSLAIDPRGTDTSSGCLYTAGRDGIIHSWDLHEDNKTTPGRKVQIHTNWVNDIVLTHDYNKGKSFCSFYFTPPLLTSLKAYICTWFSVPSDRLAYLRHVTAPALGYYPKVNKVVRLTLLDLCFFHNEAEASRRSASQKRFKVPAVNVLFY